MKFKAVSSPDELNFLSLQWAIYFLSSAGLLVLLSFFISPLFYKFFLLTGALICFLIIFLFAIEVFEKKEIKKLEKEKEIELTSSIRHSFNGPGNSNIELSIKEASKNFPIEFIYYKNEKYLVKHYPI